MKGAGEAGFEGPGPLSLPWWLALQPCVRTEVAQVPALPGPPRPGGSWTDLAGKSSSALASPAFGRCGKNYPILAKIKSARK